MDGMSVRFTGLDVADAEAVRGYLTADGVSASVEDEQDVRGPTPVVEHVVLTSGLGPLGFVDAVLHLMGGGTATAVVGVTDSGALEVRRLTEPAGLVVLRADDGSFTVVDPGRIDARELLTAALTSGVDAATAAARNSGAVREDLVVAGEL